MISIIVPVYNTEKYLSQCLESITNQSYKNIEIILINDGSTDRSGEICRIWSKKDSRIILIEQENQGQGNARNKGIKIASGKYLLFVDSDDYIDKTLVEDAYRYIEKMKAQICIFRWRSFDEVGMVEMPLPMKLKWVQRASEYRELLNQSFTLLWDKLYSTELLKKSGYEMTNNVCEDLVFVPFLLSQANGICTLDKPLYNYRYCRQGNMSTDYFRYPEVIESVNILNQIFVERDLFDYYLTPLFFIAFQIFKDILYRVSGRKNMALPEDAKKYYPELRSKFENCLCKWFEKIICREIMQSNYLLIGSYNLRPIIREVLFDEEHLIYHFGASSIISMMSDKKSEYVSLKTEESLNEYRKVHVQNDINKKFIMDSDIFDGVDYILLDLLEETNDLMEFDDTYITYSEFFKEIQNSIDEPFKVIKPYGKKREELFRSKCLEFITILRKKKKKVVLFENFLNEKYSEFYDDFVFYKEIEAIRKMNNILKSYYDFFEESMPEAMVMRANGGEKLMFTDSNFPFGCLPENYNIGYYKYMAAELSRSIVDIRDTESENISFYYDKGEAKE